MAFTTGAPSDPYVSQRTDTYSMIRIIFSDASQTFSIPVPAGCIVEDVYASVGEAFDGTPSITVGDSTTAAGYLQNGDVALGTAGTATTPAIKRASTSARAYANGKRYATADNVLVAWTKGTTPTVGTVDIIVSFIRYPLFGIPAAVASTATL